MEDKLFSEFLLELDDNKL